MMIDENETFKRFGYVSTDWAPNSSKYVVAVCDGCGLVREIKKRYSNKMCLKCACNTPERAEMLSRTHKGKVVSDEQKRKQHEKMVGRPQAESHIEKRAVAISASWTDERKEFQRNMMMGEGNPNYGKPMPPEARAKNSKSHTGLCASDETKQKMSEVRKGVIKPAQMRQRLSATKMGISYDAWEDFAVGELYCPKFNEHCRESNREKYERHCFLCGKTEAENERKLSVHHCDMNRDQGCNGHAWKLVPLCMEHHGAAHTPLWTARIQYLLANVW